MAQERKFYEWAARIRCDDSELGGSFAVLIFIGDVPKQASEWRSAESYVGAHHVHTSRGRATRRSDAANTISETEGFVHLNDAIAERSGLNSFDPEVVEPYLKKEIDWRVQKVRQLSSESLCSSDPDFQADRSAAQLEDLSSLQVVVFATPMAWDRNDPFPKPSGESRQYRGITEGRQGGYRSS